jgi:ribosomal protein S18 acetylase RimI-like enzyme
MNLQILKATFEDLETILTLQKECYLAEAERHNEYNIPPLTQTLECIQEDFNQGTLFLKGMIEGQTVASVRGYSRNNTSFIGRLMVKKEFQNNKFGQALMKEIEACFTDSNRFELFTGFKSENNILLYQKLGYKEFKRQFITEKLTLVYLEKFK